jgi:hypothetical protein
MDATHAEVPSATEAARAEQHAVMTDPAHPMHAAWRLGHTAVVDRHLTPFYEKAAAGVSAVTINEEGITTGRLETEPPAKAGESPAPSNSNQDPLIDETKCTDEQRVGLTTAREELGDQFTSRVQAAQRGIAYLNREPTGMDMLTAWDPVVDKLGRYKDAFTFEAFALLDKYMTRANQGG